VAAEVIATDLDSFADLSYYLLPIGLLPISQKEGIMVRGTLMLLAVGLSLGAENPKEDAVKKELAAFEGTWKFVSLEVNGMKFPIETLKDTVLIIKGDTFTQKEPGVSYGGTFKFDLTKGPKHLDITFTEGPEKGKTISAIYELKGDTYKVCLNLGGKGRPTEFSAKAGSGRAYEVLERVKP
jgi:uncharacterized protein (TIGR03067 family)